MGIRTLCSLGGTRQSGLPSQFVSCWKKQLEKYKTAQARKLPFLVYFFHKSVLILIICTSCEKIGHKKVWFWTFNENIKFLQASQAVFCTRKFSVGGNPQKTKQLALLPVSSRQVTDRPTETLLILILSEQQWWKDALTETRLTEFNVGIK